MPGIRGGDLDGHATSEPAGSALTAVTNAVALPSDFDLSVLRACWRHATDALQSRIACPVSATPLGIASWDERDDVLHERLAAECGRSPRFVDGMAISTGAQASLHVYGNPLWVDASTLSRLIAEVSTAHQDIRAGRRPAFDGVGDDTAEPSAEPVVRTRPVPAAPPALEVLRDAGRPHLHLYYPAIGAEAAYQPLAAALPASWTITTCADADHAVSVQEMAAWYLSPLQSRFSRPDLLGGWSMGGLVGLEAARQLLAREAAAQVSLVLLDSPPPQGTAPEPLSSGQLTEFSEFLWRSFGISSFQPRRLDAGDSDQVGLGLIAAALRQAGEDVPAGWLAEWLAGYRRQLRLLATSRGDRPVRASGLLVVGDITDAHVEAWRRSLSGPLIMQNADGGHFDLLRPPVVTKVARLIATHYAELRRPFESRSGGSA
jgi:thioesterase domain-containing protein